MSEEKQTVMFTLRAPYQVKGTRYEAPAAEFDRYFKKYGGDAAEANAALVRHKIAKPVGAEAEVDQPSKNDNGTFETEMNDALLRKARADAILAEIAVLEASKKVAGSATILSGWLRPGEAISIVPRQKPAPVEVSIEELLCDGDDPEAAILTAIKRMRRVRAHNGGVIGDRAMPPLFSNETPIPATEKRARSSYEAQVKNEVFDRHASVTGPTPDELKDAKWVLYVSPHAERTRTLAKEAFEAAVALSKHTKADLNELVSLIA